MKEEVLFNLADIEIFFKDFNVEEFAFDTETLPTTQHPKSALRYSEQKISGIQFYDGNKACYIPLIDDEQNDINGQRVPRRTETLVWINEQVFKKSNKVICQNIPFDAAVVHKYGINFDKAKWFDTAVASHLLNENTPSNLKWMVRDILDREVEDFNPDLSHYCQEFYDYGLDDAINTWDLYQHFLPQILEDEKLADLFFKIEMPFQRVITEMRINGVDVDKQKLYDQKLILKKDKFDLAIEIHKYLELPYQMVRDIYGNDVEISSELNLNSSRQVGKILFEDLGLEVVEETPTGLPKTGKVTLEKYKEHPFVKLLTQYKGCEKLLNAFVTPLPDHIEVDGKVRPNFRDTGTVTGRLSCSQPNLQQLADPKKAAYTKINFRENFIAPEGYKMFSADYSGQEVCVMAQESKDPTLVEALRKGWDSHLAVANKFFELGLSDEELFDGSEAHDEAKKKYKVERGKAKTINFGLAYGKGAYGFSKDFGISEDEAQEIVDDYFADMPLLKEVIDQTHEEVKKYGEVRNLAGRYRRFTPNEQGYYSNSALRQAFNFKIQGFSADMIRASAVNIWNRKRKNPEWDLQFIMTVHDELVFIVKEEYFEEAGKFVKEVMETTVNFVVPMKCDIEVGNNYGDSK